jgi:hypothetical protein
VFAQKRDGLRHHIIAPEGCHRKALLAGACMLRKPSVGNRFKLIDELGNARGRNDFKSQAVALAAPQGIAKTGAPAALEGKFLQWDARLFANLHDSQSSVEVEWQARWRHLIKRHAPAMRIGQLDKTPHQFDPFIARADRIAERCPGTAMLGKHQK